MDPSRSSIVRKNGISSTQRLSVAEKFELSVREKTRIDEERLNKIKNDNYKRFISQEDQPDHQTPDEMIRKPSVKGKFEKAICEQRRIEDERVSLMKNSRIAETKEQLLTDGGVKVKHKIIDWEGVFNQLSASVESLHATIESNFTSANSNIEGRRISESSNTLHAKLLAGAAIAVSNIASDSEDDSASVPVPSIRVGRTSLIPSETINNELTANDILKISAKTAHRNASTRNDSINGGKKANDYDFLMSSSSDAYSDGDKSDKKSRRKLKRRLVAEAEISTSQTAIATINSVDSDDVDDDESDTYVSFVFERDGSSVKKQADSISWHARASADILVELRSMKTSSSFLSIAEPLGISPLEQEADVSKLARLFRRLENALKRSKRWSPAHIALAEELEAVVSLILKRRIHHAASLTTQEIKLLLVALADETKRYNLLYQFIFAKLVMEVPREAVSFSAFVGMFPRLLAALKTANPYLPARAPLIQTSADIGTLFNNAASTKPLFDDMARFVANAVGAEVQLKSVKSLLLVCEKTALEHEGTFKNAVDLVRAKVFCSSVHKMTEAVSVLSSLDRRLRLAGYPRILIKGIAGGSSLRRVTEATERSMGKDQLQINLLRAESKLGDDNGGAECTFYLTMCLDHCEHICEFVLALGTVEVAKRMIENHENFRSVRTAKALMQRVTGSRSATFLTPHATASKPDSMRSVPSTSPSSSRSSSPAPSSPPSSRPPSPASSLYPSPSPPRESASNKSSSARDQEFQSSKLNVAPLSQVTEICSKSVSALDAASEYLLSDEGHVGAWGAAGGRLQSQYRTSKPGWEAAGHADLVDAWSSAGTSEPAPSQEAEDSDAPPGGPEGRAGIKAAGGSAENGNAPLPSLRTTSSLMAGLEHVRGALDRRAAVSSRVIQVSEYVTVAVWNLVRDNPMEQRALGAAGAGALIVAILQSPYFESALDAVRSALLLKVLKAMRVLCRCGNLLRSSDMANISACREAGACEVLVAIMLRYAPAHAAVAREGFAAIRSLVVDETSRFRLGVAGIAEVLAVSLESHGVKNTRVAQAATAAMNNAVFDGKLGDRFRSARLYSALAVTMKEHSEKNADIVESSCRAMATLSSDILNRRLMGDEGLCPVIVQALATHGGINAVVAEAACGALTALSADCKANRHRFGSAGVCPVLVELLRLYGRSDSSVVKHASDAVYHIASKPNVLGIVLTHNNRSRFMAAGAREVLASIIANTSLTEDARLAAHSALEKLK